MLNYENDKEISDILDKYAELKKSYDVVKSEMENLKKLALEKINADLKVGTNHLCNENYKLKSVIAVKYEVKVDDNTEFNLAMQTLANRNGYETTVKLVKWKPTLDKKLYDSLSDQDKSVLNPFLTLSYSTPTLVLEEK